ncbi:hypothetical protein [Natrinema halophilum]|uniref:Uncharacterized protein n=1 Tax=Natrinema halophilum TaxID=1699371 RepID=A0A7D5GIR6_9EURY|nr:hypothetical protein [Natrinema halophilum]QLG50068.1 hypothetical protein HYG82_14985 [Natrinema halophilum]
MSAEQRSPDFTTPADERIRTRQSDSTDEPIHHCVSPNHQSAVGPSPPEPPLSYRIEQTRLRIRIAVLERALETSENRRQAVIQQYERLLADRNDVSDRHRSESPSRSRSLLAQIFAR